MRICNPWKGFYSKGNAMFYFCAKRLILLLCGEGLGGQNEGEE
jgi:hypothetical protein